MAGRGARLEVGDPHVAEADVARLRDEQPGEEPRERRLADAAGADDREVIAVFDDEIELADDRLG